MFKRFSWKLFAGLTAVLTAIVVGACLFIHKAQERKPFVGKIDPKSGYQCRFTLASNWKLSREMSGGSRWSGGENDVFSLTPSPIRQWIDSRLLHKKSPTPSTLALFSGTSKDFGPDFKFIDGYPEPILLNGSMPPQVTIYTHRHLKIDGCSATVMTVGVGPQRGTELFVSVPDRSLLYVVGGGTQSPQEASLDPEIQAIIASFHVEKRQVPTTSKQ